MPNQSHQERCKETCMTNAFSLELFQQRKQEEREKANFDPQDFSSTSYKTFHFLYIEANPDYGTTTGDSQLE